MNDWLTKVAAAIGSNEQLSDEDADALLKIARIAAHESDDRRNAPLPKLGATPPDWARAAAFASELGLGNLAGRLESMQ